MYSDIKLDNCPDKFAMNCKNYEVSCFKCKANNKSKYLLYAPINKSINEHPANTIQKSKVVSYSRKAKAKELNIIKDIPFFQNTRLSGSLNGDGDAFMYLPNYGKLRVEIKCRYTNTSTKPTLQEYRESKTQNIDIILIHSVKSNRSYYYLTYKLFSFVFKSLFYYPTVLNYDPFNFINVGSEEFFAFYKYNEDNKVTSQFIRIIEDKKLIKNLLGKLHFDDCSVFIFKNVAGTYAALNESTFYELIYLYKYIMDNINNG